MLMQIYGGGGITTEQHWSYFDNHIIIRDRNDFLDQRIVRSTPWYLPYIMPESEARHVFVPSPPVGHWHQSQPGEKFQCHSVTQPCADCPSDEGLYTARGKKNVSEFLFFIFNANLLLKKNRFANYSSYLLYLRLQRSNFLTCLDITPTF